MRLTSKDRLLMHLPYPMPYTHSKESERSRAVVSERDEEYHSHEVTIGGGVAMPISVLILLLGVASAWLPDRGDPRRAGVGEGAAPEICPEPNCNEVTSPGDNEIVCEAGHAYAWDESREQYVPSDE
jgi:hypothetical protein